MELTAEERPRERLIRRGAQSLTTAELLAILLRTGTRGTNVLDLAREILAHYGGKLERICNESTARLCRHPGVGSSKAVTVAAAFELGRRLALELAQGPALEINSPRDAYLYLKDLYGADDHEECWCLMLKRNRRVLSSLCVGVGGETFTRMDIKKIVRTALDLGASAVIISHNHPSGDPMPSSADIHLTDQLRRALEMFELALMDHIVISVRGYYSFSQDEVFRE